MRWLLMLSGGFARPTVTSINLSGSFACAM
jgi:hypothetical protein